MSNPLLPALVELRDAAALVHRHLRPTPQIRWPQLETRTGVDELWIKHENHQPVGAFKLRGGLVYMDALSRREPQVSTVISATRGNHGQSIAVAAKASGLRAVIVVPLGNSTEKNAAMRSQGAELIEHGHDYQAALDHALSLSKEHGWHFVSGIHPDLVKGCASIHLELMESHPQLRTVYVPVGMGSGICAAIAVRDALGLDVEIVGVTSSQARATVLSIASGDVVESEANVKIADGVACRKPNADAIAAMRAGAARFIEVSDDAVAEAMRLLFATTHNVAEGAGALALAGLMQDTQRASGPCAVMLTGGNVDSALFAQVLSEQV